MMDHVLDLRAEARGCMPQLESPDELSRIAAVCTWQARMLNEYASSGVFESLAAQLHDAGFDGALSAECHGFAAEERRHGVLCGAVVEALGGEARGRLPAARPYPLHPRAPGRAAALRNVIHVCCMSETVAVALIGAERLEMPDGPLRALLSRIYADEVGHARFGWRLLEAVAGTLEDRERGAVNDYLAAAFQDLTQHELSHLPERPCPPAGAALGLCDGRPARALFHDTVTTVIRPGLQRWFDC
jgi:hypothetical protein